MADPPGISFFSVHRTKPPGSKSRSADFKILPHVVGAEGPFVLFGALFFSRYGEDEYFMYRVGDGESLAPSLKWIPLPDGSDSSLHMVRDFGIVPRCARGQYLLAALSDYQLQIYSSEKRTWSTRTLINSCPGIDKIRPEKVIRLEEGVLGSVDFYQGLLVCDLRQDPPTPTPVVYFIPLPKPLPENREKLNISNDEGPSPRLFRDVTCVNGVLRFIEMPHSQVTENPSGSSDQDCLYDADLIRSLKRKHMEEKPKVRYGWRAVTWNRMVGSNCWRKGRFVDVADILVDESACSSLLSGLRGKCSGKLAFKDLYSVFPTLSTNSDDVLYLKSMVHPSDEHGLVVAVDLGDMALKSVGAYFFEDHDPNRQGFRPCTLSCHLNITPGKNYELAYALHTVPASLFMCSTHICQFLKNPVCDNGMLMNLAVSVGITVSGSQRVTRSHRPIALQMIRTVHQ
jgi:hypothetical protein